MKVAQPVDQAVTVALAGAVDLGAVAGGEDHRLADILVTRQRGQGLAEYIGTKGEPFAQGDGGRLVIDAEGVDTHGSTDRWMTNIIYGSASGERYYTTRSATKSRSCDIPSLFSARP